MTKYIAFLRAINVGGKNLIKMDRVAGIFSSFGFKNVKTFIQSGNVYFETAEMNRSLLSEKIEKELHKFLTKDVIVFIRTVDELKKIIKSDPFKKLQLKVETKLYVSFLKEKLNKKPKLPFVSGKKDCQLIKISGLELYSITPEINGRFGFPNNFVENELQIIATTRNWNTVIKINELFGK